MLDTNNAGEASPADESIEFMSLELTTKCPLKCLHCYSESAPTLPLNQGMSFEAWVDVMRQARRSRCRDVQFIGGEPTLYPKLPQLVEAARGLDYEFIEVYTSGTTLTKSLVSTLRQSGGALAFSVYSHRPEVHDMITRMKGSHAKTVRGIKLALRSGVPVRVGIVEMAQNRADLEATKKYLRRVGVTHMKVDRVRGVGRGVGCVNDSLMSLDPMKELCGKCWRGRLMVDSHGDLYPCVFARFARVGHVSDGLETVLGGARLKTFRAASKSADSTVCNRGSDCIPDCVPPHKVQKAGCAPWEDCGPTCVPPNKESMVL